MTRRFSQVGLAALVAGLLVGLRPALGELRSPARPKHDPLTTGLKSGLHWQWADKRCGLPPYDYGNDGNRIGAVVGARFIGEDQVILNARDLQLMPDPLESETWAKRGIQPARESLLSQPAFVRQSAPGQVRVLKELTVVPSISPYVIPQVQVYENRSETKPLVVRRKHFLLNATAVVADPVRLDQVQLALYETGEVATSGRIVHLGGPNPGLRGNNVTIRVRAYGGVPLEGTAVPNGPLFWQGEAYLWVSRDQSRVIPLAGPFSEEVQRHFDEIQLMEVNLEYRKDR